MAQRNQKSDKRVIDPRTAIAIVAVATILIAGLCYTVTLRSSNRIEDKATVFHRPTMQGPPPGIQR